MAFDEAGQADTFARKTAICKRAYDILVQQLDFRRKTSSSTQYFAIATGLEEHNNYGVDFIEATRWIDKTCRMRISRAAFRTCRSRSAAMSRCARPCIRCSCITHQGRHGHGHRQCRTDDRL